MDKKYSDFSTDLIRRIDQVSGRVDTLEQVQKRDVQNLVQQMTYVS